MSGTSFSASAVAGTAALLQRVNLTLKSWPEGCKAILLASAGPTVSGDTWAEDNLRGIDQSDGSGALNAEIGVLIAQHRQWRDLPPAPRGWDVGSLKDNDFASQSMSKFFYKVAVPDPDPAIARNIYTVKVALAWDAKFPSNVTRVQSPTITFLLAIYKSNGGRPVRYSGSFDIIMKSSNLSPCREKSTISISLELLARELCGMGLLGTSHHRQISALSTYLLWTDLSTSKLERILRYCFDL